MIQEDKVLTRQKFSHFLLILFAATVFMGAQTDQDPELLKISYIPAGDTFEIIMTCDGPISYDSFSLVTPNRLVIDLANVAKTPPPQEIQIDDLGIAKIRTGSPFVGIARVVIQFSDDFIPYTIEESDSTLKIIIGKDVVQETEDLPVPEEPVEEPIEEAQEPQVELAEVDDKKPAEEPEEKPGPTIEEDKKDAEPVKDKVQIMDMTIGMNTGFYFMQDATFIDIYGDNFNIIRTEFSVTLPVNVPNFDIWAAMDYFQKTGKTSYFEEELKLAFTNFSLSIRYLRQIKFFVPFVGVGLDYFSYKETSLDNPLIPSVGGSQVGSHIQAGTYIHILPQLSGKIHIKYNFAKTTENSVEINLGGVEYAFGFVFHFNI